MRWKIRIEKKQKSILKEDTSNLFKEYIDKCKKDEENNRSASDIHKIRKFIEKFISNGHKQMKTIFEVEKGLIKIKIRRKK